jgi:hypothetical protein
MLDARVRLLENKLEVMASEFSGVLKELQTTIQGLAKLTTLGIKSVSERVVELEEMRTRLKETGVYTDKVVSPEVGTSGKEI